MPFYWVLDMRFNVTKAKRVRSTESLANGDIGSKNIVTGSFIVLFFLSVLSISITFALKRLFENSIYKAAIAVLFIFSFFLLWLSVIILAFLQNSSTIEYWTFARLASLLFIMGILTTYLAIIIENKSLLFLEALSSLLDSLVIRFDNSTIVATTFYVGIIPIIEETIKLLPIIILLRSYIKIDKEHSISYKLLPSLKTFILFGAITGGLFDLIEQFFILSKIEEKLYPSLIFRRSVFPLHMMNSMVGAFGIGLLLYLRNSISREKQITKKRKIYVLYLLAFMLLSFPLIYHALWNYFSRINNATILTFLGYISYPIYLIFTLFLIIHQTRHCNLCHTEHYSLLCPFVVSNIDISTICLKDAKKVEFSKDTTLFSCPYCLLDQYNGDYCLHCWSFPKLECNNCHQVLPAFSRMCWSCGTEVESIYDKMLSNSPPPVASISVGVTRFLSGLIVSLFILSIGSFSNTLSSLGYTAFFIVITSLFVTIVLWSYSKKNRSKAIIASVAITSAFLLMIVVYALYYLVVIILLLYLATFVIFALISLLCVVSIIFLAFVYFKKVSKEIQLIIR